jgi:PAS domain-containing protein
MKKHPIAGGKTVKARRRKTPEPKRRNAPKTVPRRISSSPSDEDVAVARRLEQSLRASEERYSLVAEAVAEGIYDWNIKTNALYVSPRLMEILVLREPASHLTRGTAVCIRRTGWATARRCVTVSSDVHQSWSANTASKRLTVPIAGLKTTGFPSATKPDGRYGS